MGQNCSLEFILLEDKSDEKLLRSAILSIGHYLLAHSLGVACDKNNRQALDLTRNVLKKNNLRKKWFSKMLQNFSIETAAKKQRNISRFNFFLFSLENQLTCCSKKPEAIASPNEDESGKTWFFQFFLEFSTRTISKILSKRSSPNKHNT